jgi:hypothetical protein
MPSLFGVATCVTEVWQGGLLVKDLCFMMYSNSIVLIKTIKEAETKATTITVSLSLIYGVEL